jgi:hypothetical protein
MHILNIMLPGALAFATAVTAVPSARRAVSTAAVKPHKSEFVTLGCPSSTNKVATENEQLDAIRDFSEKLFVQKDVKGAFNTYVARDLINHAADVPGDGAAAAESYVSGLVNAASFDFQSITVGQDYSTTFFKATTPQGSIASVEVSSSFFRYNSF